MLYILIVVFHLNNAGTTATALFDGKAACTAALNDLQAQTKTTWETSLAAAGCYPEGPEGATGAGANQ